MAAGEGGTVGPDRNLITTHWHAIIRRLAGTRKADPDPARFVDMGNVQRGKPVEESWARSIPGLSAHASYCRQTGGRRPTPVAGLQCPFVASAGEAYSKNGIAGAGAPNPHCSGSTAARKRKGFRCQSAVTSR